jgi:hypothetical protein
MLMGATVGAADTWIAGFAGRAEAEAALVELYRVGVQVSSPP